jgi:hypothetical protein
MEKVTTVAERILLGSAGLALVLGLIIWIGDAHELIGVHQLLGYALIASLWTLAGIAARLRVRTGIVVGAIAWGVLVLALGWTQEYLLTGSWHWVVLVLHPVISMASVPWGMWLASRIRRNASAAVPGAGEVSAAGHEARVR